MTLTDALLVTPGLVYLVAFTLLRFAEGDAAKGYTLFGSEKLGKLLFLVMVSGMVFGIPALAALAVGAWRIASRVL